MISINSFGIVPRYIFNERGENLRTSQPLQQNHTRTTRTERKSNGREQIELILKHSPKTVLPKMPGPCAVCNEPSTLICSGCKLTNYCSKDHQKIDWKQTHKGVCQPKFKLEENEKLGRHLTAARDIKKGEIIFQEPPLVLGPKSVTLPVCLGCHAYCDSKSSYECDGCGFPLCSPKCQVSDLHIDECRLMMKGKFRAKIDFETNKKEISYFPVVPIRCLLLKEKSPEKYKKVTNLQSHLQERIKTPLYGVYKKNVAEFLRERLGRKDFEEEEILNVVGILDTNAFEIRGKKTKIRGLYNTASMLAHSCTPNTKHNFLEPEMTIVITATTDIASGEIISATYTQTFWDTLSRREHLKSAKCFDCDCRRCSDPTELDTYIGAIRCIRCVSPDNFINGPYILSTEPLNADAPWKCQNCGHVMTAKQIKSGNENLKQELANTRTKSAEGLAGFLEKYGAYGAGVLHPRNYHVVQVKHALVKIYGNSEGFLYSDLSDDNLEKKIDYCHELLDLVDILDPGFSQIRGEILNELQAAMVIQAKRQYNQEKITKDAAQKTLMDALTILKEVIEILRLELDMEEFEKKLVALSKELDN